ncbi:unnamed protein product [Mucor circinelloides]
MISQQFNDQLNQFKIELKEDSLEYICNMPDDMMLTNHDEVRESTKVFLVGASINDMARNDFYQALFSSNDFKVLHIPQLEGFVENTTVFQEVLVADPKATTVAILEYVRQLLMHYIPHRAVIDNAAPIKKATKANRGLSSVIFDIMQSRVKDKLDDATQLAIK